MRYPWCDTSSPGFGGLRLLGRGSGCDAGVEGVRVQTWSVSAGFRVSGFGFWVSDFRSRVSGFGVRFSSFGFVVLDLEFHISDFGF